MTLYAYRILRDDGGEGRRCVIDQPLGDPPLQFYPETGEPIRLLMLCTGEPVPSGYGVLAPEAQRSHSASTLMTIDLRTPGTQTPT